MRTVVKVHLDTDIGGDIDDLSALAMLLRMPDVEITGITTVAEIGGKRAGYVRRVLEMEGRQEIPIAAGADVALGCYRHWPQVLLPEERYWGERIAPLPGSLDRALGLLGESIAQGARIIGIGPFTNLARLEAKRPGILRNADLYLMGGYLYPVREGYPAWGNESDYNVQVDPDSAYSVFTHSNSTLIPLSVTVETFLRRSHLTALERSGRPLGLLLARQAREFAADERMAEKLGEYQHVPSDVINFQHDPLASAIAAGWRDGVEMADVRLQAQVEGEWLYERIDPAGEPARVVTRVDGARFAEFWVETIAKAS